VGRRTAQSGPWNYRPVTTADHSPLDSELKLTTHTAEPLKSQPKTSKSRNAKPGKQGKTGKPAARQPEPSDSDILEAVIDTEIKAVEIEIAQESEKVKRSKSKPVISNETKESKKSSTIKTDKDKPKSKKSKATHKEKPKEPMPIKNSKFAKRLTLTTLIAQQNVGLFNKGKRSHQLGTSN
jgi:hypothetical protein